MRGADARFGKLFSQVDMEDRIPERHLMEQLNRNLLLRWFVGVDVDDPVWDATMFTKKRGRLLRGGDGDADGGRNAERDFRGERRSNKTEDVFGWVKTVGVMAKTRPRERRRLTGDSRWRWRPAIRPGCGNCWRGRTDGGKIGRLSAFGSGKSLGFQ